MHEHKMILATADLSKIFKIVIAKRKASIAQLEERLFRTQEVGGPIPSAGSINKWIFEKWDGVLRKIAEND